MGYKEIGCYPRRGIRREGRSTGSRLDSRYGKGDKNKSVSEVEGITKFRLVVQIKRASKVMRALVKSVVHSSLIPSSGCL